MKQCSQIEVIQTYYRQISRAEILALLVNSQVMCESKICMVKNSVSTIEPKSGLIIDDNKHFLKKIKEKRKKKLVTYCKKIFGFLG